jgi:hypothetical protein
VNCGRSHSSDHGSVNRLQHVGANTVRPEDGNQAGENSTDSRQLWPEPMHNALDGGLVNIGIGERATWRNALIERFVQIHDHHDAGLSRDAKPGDGSDPHRNAKVAAKSLAPPTRVSFPRS